MIVSFFSYSIPTIVLIEDILRYCESASASVISLCDGFSAILGAAHETKKKKAE